MEHMSLRRAKQIIYGAFYSILLGLFAAWIYYGFLKPAPSCFDGIKNQSEEGIDCGGPCAVSCSIKHVKSIETVGRILTFAPDQEHLSLLVQISNPNLDYAARNFFYTFSIYDNQGSVIQSFNGNSFVYAGEVKYILVPNAQVPRTGLFGKIEFRAENFDWVPVANLKGPPHIAILGVETNSASTSLTVDGRITNNDTVAFPLVTVVAIFKGQYSQVAGASQTIIENLLPNESRAFSIIHPPVPNVDLTGTKVLVYALRP